MGKGLIIIDLYILVRRGRPRVRHFLDTKYSALACVSENVVVAGTSYQILEVLSFCHRERAKTSPIKITPLNNFTGEK